MSPPVREHRWSIVDDGTIAAQEAFDRTEKAAGTRIGLIILAVIFGLPVLLTIFIMLPR